MCLNNSAAAALTLLQVGRSGCVIDPLLYNHWHFTSYFVDNVGRAKCGPVLRVEEGDEVLALRVGGVGCCNARACRFKAT